MPESLYDFIQAAFFRRAGGRTTAMARLEAAGGVYILASSVDDPVQALINATPNEVR